MIALPPLAARYEHFRQDVFGGLDESLPLKGWQEPMTELQLQSLWFAGQFGPDFTSTDGKRVHVRDFGVWNLGAGPDFNGCTVLVDGETHTGDIELDPDVRDWERHGHGASPEFERVVLHLFMDQPAQSVAFTRTEQYRQVTQVRLQPDMLTDHTVPLGRLAPARLGRCAVPLQTMAEPAVQSLIEAAAQRRLMAKSRRIHQCVSAQGREQAVYQALAQTLGYRHNQRPFTLLTQHLPLRRLLALQPMEREALLFGAAGFLDETPYDEARDETREYLRDLWQHWWKQRTEFTRQTRSGERQWKLHGARPGNHPQRRLGALAAMLNSWQAVMRPLKRAEAWSRDTWAETMEALRHPYWNQHYTLTANPSPKPVALIGETRLQEMLANVVYPLLVPDRPLLWQEYLELPAMLDNQKTKLASLRLFGESPLAKVFQKKLHHQQGLIQVYEDFCLPDDSACANCPFPERLAQWG